MVGLAAAGLVLYFMYLMSGLINSLFVAFIIAVMASPLLLWMRKKGAPNWLAFLITLLAVAASVLLILLFFANAAEKLAETIPVYVDEVESFEKTLESTVASLGFDALNLGALFELFELKQIFQVAGSLASSLLDALSSVFIIALFVVFMLVQYFTTPQVLLHEIISGSSYVQRIVQYTIDLRQYFIITTAIALVTGTLDTIWFVILGIPNPLIWGGVAAILSFVPSIGFWLAAIPPTLLALVIYGPLTALVTLLGILLINGFADNYVKPRYIGAGLDLAPFMVIFSVVFWALILGPMGAILGVPMTMLVKSLLIEPDGKLAWMTHVLSSGVPDEETAEEDLETAVAEDPPN